MVNPFDVLYKSRQVQPKAEKKRIEQQKESPISPPAKKTTVYSSPESHTIARRYIKGTARAVYKNPPRTPTTTAKTQQEEPYVGYTKKAYVNVARSRYETAARQVKYIQSTPSSTMFVDSSGKVITREQALASASENKNVANQQYIDAIKLPSYARVEGQQKNRNFRIYYDQKEKAKSEFKKLNPFEKFTRSLYVGATRFPEVVWSKVPVIGSGESFKELETKWITQESQLWEKGRKGDVKAVAWDAASSPAMQEVYIAGVTMGLSKAVPIAGRAAVRTGVKASGKLPRGAQFITKTTSKIVPKASKPAASGMKQNILRWGTQGWKKGTVLIEAPKGKPFYNSGIRGQQYVYKSAGSKWMSPATYAKTQSKIAGSGKFKIGFPEFKGEAGVGKVTMVGEGELYKPGLLGYKRGYYSFNVSKSVGKDVGLARLSGAGEYSDTVLRPLGYGTKYKNPYLKSVQSMYKSGYPYKSTVLEKGGLIVDYTPGMGKYVPEPKPFITRVKYSFTRSKQATGGLVRQPYQVFKKPSKSIKFGKQILVGRPSLSIPSRGLSYIPMYGVSSIAARKHKSFTISMPKYRNLTAVKPISMSKSISGSAQATYPLSYSVSKVAPVYRTPTIPTSVIKSLNAQKTLNTLKTVKHKSIVYSSYISRGIIPYFPAGAGGGRGIGGFKEFGKKTRYRFRKFDIKSPLKGVKL